MFKTVLFIIVNIVGYNQVFSDASFLRRAVINKDSLKSHQLTSPLNRWFKITTGYESSLNQGQISFNATKYATAISKWPKTRFDMEDVDGSNLANSKPRIKVASDHVMLLFEGFWRITFFASANYFIYSIRHGTSGESSIFNLDTGKLEYKDFEITGLKGNIANVSISSHDDEGAYQQRDGQYSLLSKKVVWK